eukprot:748827-Hanusia_phi.AAC.1
MERDENDDGEEEEEEDHSESDSNVKGKKKEDSKSSGRFALTSILAPLTFARYPKMEKTQKP